MAGLRNERARGFEANTRATAARTMPQECRPRKALPGSASRAWQEEKERKKRKLRHVRPQLSLGNSRFGAWNAEATAAERLHPAPLPHRRRLCPAAALPSLKQTISKKNPTSKAKKEEREKKEELKEKKKKKTKKISRKKAGGEGEKKKGREFSFSAWLSNGYLIVGGLGGNRYLPLSGACKYFCHS